MKRRILIGFIIISLLLVGLGSWLHHKHKLAQAVNSLNPAVPVVVKTVAPSTVTEQATAEGQLQANRTVTISPQANGQIVAILFNSGQNVKQGDMLFKLDDRALKAQLAAAKASLNQAQDDYNRAKRMADVHALSLQDLETAKTKFQTAQANEQQAQVALDNSVLTAPFNGTMSENTLAVGQTVSAGQSLVALVDNSILKVIYALPARYFSQIKLGQAVFVTLDTGPSQTYTAKVSYIAPQVDTNTGTLALEAVLPNTDSKLTSGLFVHVTQQLGEMPHQILIPQSSVVSSLQGNQVFKIVANKAVAVKVVPGEQEGDNIIINDGLKPGDVIVVKGQSQLKDGSLVKIIPADKI